MKKREGQRRRCNKPEKGGGGGVRESKRGTKDMDEENKRREHTYMWQQNIAIMYTY